MPRESGNVRALARRTWTPMEPQAAHGWWLVADMPHHTPDCGRCMSMRKRFYDSEWEPMNGSARR